MSQKFHIFGTAFKGNNDRRQLVANQFIIDQEAACSTVSITERMDTLIFNMELRCAVKRRKSFGMIIVVYKVHHSLRKHGGRGRDVLDAANQHLLVTIAVDFIDVFVDDLRKTLNHRFTQRLVDVLEQVVDCVFVIDRFV